MGLRLALVGLVASLGLDLPSGRDVDRWAESGRTWGCTMLDGWNMGVPAEDGEAGDDLIVVEVPPTAPATAERVVGEAAFDLVMDEIVAAFEVDAIGEVPA